jgi:hypothetical protein
MAYGSDPLSNANVIYASPIHAEFVNTLERICHDAIGAAAKAVLD